MSNARVTWANLLVELLRQPLQHERHQQAAWLLCLFATDASELEPVLLERSRDAWVRTYLLRALTRCQLSMSSVGFNALIAEFAEELTPERRAQNWPRKLAQLDTLTTLAQVGVLSDETAAVHRLVNSLDGQTAGELLSWDRIGTPKLDATTREVAYRRAALDEKVAWATFSFAESRAFLFALGELDPDKLAEALAKLTAAEVDRVFADHADALAAAVDHFALPLDFLLLRYPQDELRRIAHERLGALDLKVKNGERRVALSRPLRVLAAMADGARELDALLGDLTLTEPVRVACAGYRLALEPATSFDALPVAALANSLRFLRPEPVDRPLLEWAVTSKRVAFQYAGLTGLLHLDADLPTPLIDRARTSSEPLLYLTAFGALAAKGDSGSATRLMHEAAHAPHVVLRARALRSLRASNPLPAGYFELCAAALKHDGEVFDSYYAPATSEAALGLAWHPGLDEVEALRALVDAGLDLANDDARCAIESAIRSWLERTDASLSPVWYWQYLDALQK